MGLHSSSSNLQAYPERLPPPPAFFKHTDKLPEPDTGRDPDAEATEEHPFGPPLTTYKLLSSDYDWLDEPQPYSAASALQFHGEGRAGEAAKGQNVTTRDLGHTRFFSRARIVLVKLRKQVRSGNRAGQGRAGPHEC